MGRLVTKGKCGKSYEAEIMVITVKFLKKGFDNKMILDGVQQLCERFLLDLKQIGIQPEQVILEDQGIKKEYGKEENTAERDVIIKTKINVKFCTYVCSLIKKYTGEIIYEITYKLEDEQDKNQELLKLAVDDSRRQADIIAVSLGKSVIGVESVNDQEYMHRSLAKSITVDDINPEIPDIFNSDTPLSDKAALPTVYLEQEITIAWIMGD